MPTEQIQAAALLGALLVCSEGWKLLQSVAMEPLAVVSVFVRLHGNTRVPDDQVASDAHRQKICLFQLESVVRSNHILADQLLLAAAADPSTVSTSIEAALPVLLTGTILFAAAETTSPHGASMEHMCRAITIVLALLTSAKQPSMVAFVSSCTAGAGLAAAIGGASQWILRFGPESCPAGGEVDVCLPELLSLFATLWGTIGQCGLRGVRLLAEFRVVVLMANQLAEWSTKPLCNGVLPSTAVLPQQLLPIS